MNRYRDLSYLEGTSLKTNRDIVRGKQEEDYIPPKRVLFVKDYPETILIQLEYQKAKIMRMISKASLFCGDIEIKDCYGDLLVGDKVRYQR